MTMPPFNFAWVDGDQTTFNPDTMAVVDEDIFSFHIQHDEGQTPTLDLTIVNPRVGLLSATRKQWGWLSYNALSGVMPLFFGVLVGVPSDLFAELITIKFLARSQTYITDKQAAAETLRTFPNYDPIWLSVEKRDDPDAILEGWSSLYHIDRVTLETTASDILVGEDGTLVFEENDAFYKSVKLEIGEAPLANIQVQATTHWTQRSIGYVSGPPVNLQSYTGGSWLSDWPKPGASLGGGWTVESSFVTDVYKVDQTPMAGMKMSITVNDPEAQDCSINHTSNESTFPALLYPQYETVNLFAGVSPNTSDPFEDNTPSVPPQNLNANSNLTAAMTESFTIGFCDPPTTNQGPALHVTGVTIPLWTINAEWALRYEARRQYSEFLVMDVTANTQSVLTSPSVEQNTETMKISSADVGEPLLVYDAWTDFAGESVSLAQIIFPNDQTLPGGLSYQICVQAGTAGTDEPNFSYVPGTLTNDGSVVWASLGESPLTNQPEWSSATGVALGEIIGYAPVAFNQETGQMEETGQFAFYMCTTSGVTNAVLVEINYIPPITESDEPTPAPQQFFYIAGPAFNAAPGAQITDGSVTWTSLGTTPAYMAIPIGGNSINVTANNFFPTPRGQTAIEYLIMKARARLRKRARAVKVSWTAPFDSVVAATCRMNATLYDPRLPGGAATGKIISYELSSEGGKMLGHLQIGVAVGYGGHVGSWEGTPVYAQAGYVQPGYQQYEGEQIAITESDGIADINYTPPLFAPYDDGLTFPLKALPTLGGGGLTSSAAEQLEVLVPALRAQATLENLSDDIPAISQATGLPPAQVAAQYYTSATASAWMAEQANLYWTARALPYVMEANPVSYELQIQPVTNGPFQAAYSVTCSPLEIPQGINLEAVSSP